MLDDINIRCKLVLKDSSKDVGAVTARDAYGNRPGPDPLRDLVDWMQLA